MFVFCSLIVENQCGKRLLSVSWSVPSWLCFRVCVCMQAHCHPIILCQNGATLIIFGCLRQNKTKSTVRL